MRAMILAAGFGNRLTPLTSLIPKPLIPVIHQPLIVYTLELFKKHGITSVMINTHYLGSKIVEFLGDGTRYDVHIQYSVEPMILGTGGGIRKAADFLRDDDFIVINGDILIEVDFVELMAQHKRTQSLATMVVRKDPASKKYGEILLKGEGSDQNRITGILGHGRGTDSYMFTGVHAMSPRVLEYLPENQFSTIIDAFYLPALKNQEPLAGYVYVGRWSDLGKFNSYLETVLDLLMDRFPEGAISKMVRIHPSSKLNGAVFIGESSIVEENCSIGPNVVIGRNVHVKSGSTLKNCILWDDVVCKERTIYDRAVVSPSDVIEVR